MAERVVAYCVKCKEMREIKDPKQVILKNGRAAMQGQCLKCGTALMLVLPETKQ